MQEIIFDVAYKRGLPEMNSCITGFIQYKPTNVITNKLTKSKAPPNKKVWSLEGLSSVDCWTIAWKFWFICRFDTLTRYKKPKNNEALTGKLIRSF